MKYVLGLLLGLLGVTVLLGANVLAERWHNHLHGWRW